MSQGLTLRIGEIRIDADPGKADPEAIRTALEAALSDLARRLQERLADADLNSLTLPDLTFRNDEAQRFLATSDYRRLAEALAAEIERGIGGAR